MKERLITIIEDLKAVARNQALNISDDVLFAESCGFLRGEFANERFNQNKETQEVKKATDKQLAFIQKLADKKGKKIDINTNMSSFEANKLIKELQ